MLGFYGHNGGIVGSCAFMVRWPEDGVTVVTAANQGTNLGGDADAIFLDIVKLLYPDANILCEANGYLYGTISNSEHGGYCYNWGAGNCYSCRPNYNDYEQDVVYWSDYCNKNFSGCGGNCLAKQVCIAGFLCPDQ
jgi:hypothetical protein